jgi:cytosine permease
MGRLKDWWTFNPEEEAKSNDSVHKPLTFDKRRNALPLLILGFTWGFLVTGLLIGGTIGPYMPFYSGTVPATIIGCLVLFVIAVLTGMVGYKLGGTNDMAFQFAYGKKGRRMPAIFLLVVIMGFQGIVVGGTASFWLKGTDHPAFFWVALFFGLLFTYTCYVGINLIEKISNPAMVLLIFISIYAIFYNISKVGGWSAFNSKTMEMAANVDGGPMSMATAINLVIGSWIAGAVLTSDFTRFARNKWVAIGMLAICFFFTQVLLIGMGAIGAVISGSYDFTQYLFGISPVMGIIALIAMTLAMWTSSNTNLYLPSTQVAAIFKKPFKVAVVICGLIGTMLGAFGFFEQFSSFIGAIAAIIPPLAGPMIADFWIVHRTKYEVKYLNQLPEINIPSVIAATAGIIATLMCTGFPTLGFQPVALLAQPWIVPSILGVIVSMVIYLVSFYVFKALGIHSGYSKAIENEGINQEPALTGDEEDNIARVNI